VTDEHGGSFRRLAISTPNGQVVIGTQKVAKSTFAMQLYAMGETIRSWRPRKWTSASDYPTSRQSKRNPRGRRRNVPQWGLAATIGAIIGFGAAATSVWAGPKIVSPGSAFHAINGRFGSCYVGGGWNCVVDGDTFYMDGVKIRIADIDAPETHPPRCDLERRLGYAATKRLRQLLNSGPVILSRIDRDEDVYGRKLRNARVNGADVGETLVSEGLAHRYVHGKLPWC
jgi:endonuclease YncB( thermonuclease family)